MGSCDNRECVALEHAVALPARYVQPPGQGSVFGQEPSDPGAKLSGCHGKESVAPRAVPGTPKSSPAVWVASTLPALSADR